MATKKLPIICALAILVALASVASAETDGREIIVLGDPACHACRVLKEFFDEENISYVFVELSECGQEEFLELANITGLGYYIPLSIVYANGEVKAVVSGAVRETDFWEKMFQTKTLILHNGAIGRKASKTVAEKVNKIAMEIISKCVNTETEAELETVNAPSKGKQQQYGNVLPWIIGSALILIVVLIRIVRAFIIRASNSKI